MLPQSPSSLTYQVWATQQHYEEQPQAMRVVAQFRYFLEALDQRAVYASRNVYSVVRDADTGASYPARDIAGLEVV